MTVPATTLQRPAWAVAGFYWLMTRTMALALRLCGDWRLTGAGNVPASGALLVVANHLNNSDPPLLGASIRGRRIHFMAKIELFEHPVWRWPVRFFGAFPVRRGEADLRALRTAQSLLEAGQSVGLLPEGHRNRRGTGMQQAHAGAALIALRTGAPVLPVGITGSQQVRNPSVICTHPTITVTIGVPFRLARTGRIDADAVRAGTETIMRRIAALLPPEYQGVWAATGATATRHLDAAAERGAEPQARVN